MKGISEKTITTVARLYEARRTAKLILDDRYAGVMADYGAIIKQLSSAPDFNGNELSAAMHWVNKAIQGGSNEMTIVAIFAAAVELLESSK